MPFCPRQCRSDQDGAVGLGVCRFRQDAPFLYLPRLSFVSGHPIHLVYFHRAFQTQRWAGIYNPLAQLLGHGLNAARPGRCRSWAKTIVFVQLEFMGNLAVRQAARPGRCRSWAKTVQTHQVQAQHPHFETLMVSRAGPEGAVLPKTSKHGPGEVIELSKADRPDRCRSVQDAVSTFVALAVNLGVVLAPLTHPRTRAKRAPHAFRPPQHPNHLKTSGIVYQGLYLNQHPLSLPALPPP